jgi:hypothetical protein
VYGTIFPLSILLQDVVPNASAAEAEMRFRNLRRESVSADEIASRPTDGDREAGRASASPPGERERDRFPVCGPDSPGVCPTMFASPVPFTRAHLWQALQ